MVTTIFNFLLLLATASAQLLPPEPCLGYCTSHDPSVVRHTDGTYFRFSSGNTVATSRSLHGPWTRQPDALVGAVGGAPDVHHVGDKYYMYYQHTVHGKREYSYISVATSPDMAPGSWNLHGNSIPSNPNYNLIDANMLVIPPPTSTGKNIYYLSFGSFWEDIFQIHLQDPPLQVADSSPVHLEYNKTSNLPRGDNPSEGSFQFMWTPKSIGKRFFYLFFSSGYCCTKGYDIPTGEEYKIMVCRSEDPSGPFVDKEGRSCLTQNGGTLVYGSMRRSDPGIVYAPGGQGVLYDADLDGGSVVLYYHYIAGFTNVDHPATFGWNKLEFDAEGWPYVTTLSGNAAAATY